MSRHWRIVQRAPICSVRKIVVDPSKWIEVEVHDRLLAGHQRAIDRCKVLIEEQRNEIDRLVVERRVAVEAELSTLRLALQEADPLHGQLQRMFQLAGLYV